MSEVMKKNRLLLLLLSAVLGLCMVWAFGAQKVYADDEYYSDASVNGVWYDVRDGESTAGVYGTDKLQGSVTIMDQVEIGKKMYPVTKIRKGAFAGYEEAINKDLTSVSIPATVTEIEEYAFANTGLTKVIMPYSVQKIGPYAFGYNATYYEIWDEEKEYYEWGYKNPVAVPGFTIEAAAGSVGFNYGKQNGFITYDPGIMTVTVNKATVNATAIKNAIAASGGKQEYIANIVLGKKVKKIAPNTFKPFKNVKTVYVKSSKLTKKTVKNSMKGSKVQKIKVKIGKKKVNKKYVKKYKKFFTKKNAGKNVKVGL